MRSNYPNQFLSRSLQYDNKMLETDSAASFKLWDLRMAKGGETAKLMGQSEPRCVWAWKDASLFNMCRQQNIALSANERVAVTGTSVRKGSGQHARLMGYDTLTGELLCSEPILPKDQSINQVVWSTQLGNN